MPTPVPSPATASAANPEAERIPSPCRRQCTLDEDSLRCIGCLRTLAEIKAWRGMSPADQRALLAVLEERRRPLPAGAVGITPPRG